MSSPLPTLLPPVRWKIHVNFCWLEKGNGAMVLEGVVKHTVEAPASIIPNPQHVWNKTYTQK